MRRWLPILLLSLAALLLTTCSEDKQPDDDASVTERTPDAPRKKRLKRILVDHIVISFRGAKNDAYGSSRTREEAEKHARSLFERLKAGVGFGLLKKVHCDVNQPRYFVLNKGMKPTARTDGIGVVSYEAYYAEPRRIAFALKVWEYGLAEYHERHCPDGYRIVYRMHAYGEEYK